MCGIIGIVGNRNVSSLIIEGLRRLEYRGYDSAGIATLLNGHIEHRRSKGKLNNLEAILNESPLDGFIGIGHTRWATHGVPSETNAHPITNDYVAVVHNGIIENYQELKNELIQEGFQFKTETDTEIAATLIAKYMKEGLSPEEAVKKMVARIEGAYSLAMVFLGHHDLMIGVRYGTPLTIGLGEGENYLASDAIALSSLTSNVCYLDDGDIAFVSKNEIRIHDKDGKAVERKVTKSSYTGNMTNKGEYRHFMLKEIYEQPEVIADTVSNYLSPTSNLFSIPQLQIDFNSVSRLTISACGTAYYAGLVSKYWFEKYAKLPVDIDIASEFRYRSPPLDKDGFSLVVSQSGETLDTLEALKYMKKNGQKVMSIVNVPESTIARASDFVMPTLAGPEIGVASTKAFTTQLVTLLIAAIHAAHQRKTIGEAEAKEMLFHLREIPALIVQALQLDDHIQKIAKEMIDAKDALYLGRGSLFPIAMEGALKLKEISYIHAEGYAAGELKHGPIALIDENVPVIALAPTNELFEKTASNIQEVKARGAKVLFVTDQEGEQKFKADVNWKIILPNCHESIAPILYSIPMQLLAYHIAVLKGTDVDQPRNLAKSVTVE